MDDHGLAQLRGARRGVAPMIRGTPPRLAPDTIIPVLLYHSSVTDRDGGPAIYCYTLELRGACGRGRGVWPGGAPDDRARGRIARRTTFV
jgi:hypothetical protein